MNITMLKSKIHRAVVTQAELNYVGSITVDSEHDRRRTGIRCYVFKWCRCQTGSGRRPYHSDVLCFYDT